MSFVQLNCTIGIVPLPLPGTLCCRGCSIPQLSSLGYRWPMFAGDAVFPGEVHWGTRCPMFAGDVSFPGEVYCMGHRCPMFVGGAVSPVKFTGAQDMPNVCKGCRIPR